MNLKEKFDKHPLIYCLGVIASTVAIILGIIFSIFPVSVDYYKDRLTDCEQEYETKADSVAVLTDSLMILSAYINDLRIKEYDSLIANYELGIGDSIMPFDGLTKIKIVDLFFDEFTNEKIVGLKINFVFYQDLKYMDAEYVDSISSNTKTYNFYESKLSKGQNFPFHTGKFGAYKCKLVDFSKVNDKYIGIIEFYKRVKK